MSTTTKKIAEKAATSVSQDISVRRPKTYLPELYDWDEALERIAESQRSAKDEDGNSLWDEQVTETAGFVPIEVRMKQMEQAGLVQQAIGSELTAEDVRAAWLSSDFEISPDDELEDIVAKDRARREFLTEMKARNQKEYEETQSKALSSLTKEQYQAVINSLVEKYNITPKEEAEQSDTQADSSSE